MPRPYPRKGPPVPARVLPHDPESVVNYERGGGFLLSLKGVIVVLSLIPILTVGVIVMRDYDFCIGVLLVCFATALILLAPSLAKRLKE